MESLLANDFLKSWRECADSSYTPPKIENIIGQQVASFELDEEDCAVYISMLGGDYITVSFGEDDTVKRVIKNGYLENSKLISVNIYTSKVEHLMYNGFITVKTESGSFSASLACKYDLLFGCELSIQTGSEN